MRKVLVLAFFLVSVTSTVMAQDPVKVDSKHYSVEFENSEVRVLRVKYGPNEKSVMHKHPNAVAIFMTGVNGKFNFPDGTSQDVTSKAGEVRWTPEMTHLPENKGDQPFEVIVVELKGKPSAKRPAKKPYDVSARK